MGSSRKKKSPNSRSTTKRTLKKGTGSSIDIQNADNSNVIINNENAEFVNEASSQQASNQQTSNQQASNQQASSQQASSQQASSQQASNQQASSQQTSIRCRLKRKCRYKPTLPKRYKKLKEYYNFNYFATFSCSNMGSDDLSYLFADADDKLENDLAICERRLVEITGLLEQIVESTEGNVNLANRPTTVADQTHSDLGILAFDFDELMNEFDMDNLI